MAKPGRFDFNGRVSAIVTRTVAELADLIRRNTADEVNRLLRQVLGGQAPVVAAEPAPKPGELRRGGQDRLRSAVESYERQLLVHALDANEWNFFATAQYLGMPHTTVKYKCRKYGLRSPRGRGRRAHG